MDTFNWRFNAHVSWLMFYHSLQWLEELCQNKSPHQPYAASRTIEEA